MKKFPPVDPASPLSPTQQETVHQDAGRIGARIGERTSSAGPGQPVRLRRYRRIARILRQTVGLLRGASTAETAPDSTLPGPEHGPSPVELCNLGMTDGEAKLGRLEALERRVAELLGAVERLEALERRATELQGMGGRLDELERRAMLVDHSLELERGEMDWALGTLEGVTAQIGDYHAYRESDEYRAAYTAAEPLVSVCVATMDRSTLLLERCIASVLSQTYRNLQIIVVGDNCTDDTMQRLAALGDCRIQFVNLPERGPYPRPGRDRWYVAGTNAVNHALSLCKGDFITHLDDDDRMAPHRIETMLTAALQDRADFLWHSFLYENQDRSWMVRGKPGLECGQVTTGSIFYQRYFARIPWDVHAYRLGEPGDWNRIRKIRIMRPRLRYVDEPLLYHHVELSQAAFVARDGERFLE